jgi:hypothetical protein
MMYRNGQKRPLVPAFQVCYCSAYMCDKRSKSTLFSRIDRFDRPDPNIKTVKTRRAPSPSRPISSCAHQQSTFAALSADKLSVHAVLTRRPLHVSQIHNVHSISVKEAIVVQVHRFFAVLRHESRRYWNVFAEQICYIRVGSKA